jgi:hypothetical protein
MPLLFFIFASTTTSVDWCVKRNKIRQSTSMKTNDRRGKRERESVMEKPIEQKIKPPQNGNQLIFCSIFSLRLTAFGESEKQKK